MTDNEIIKALEICIDFVSGGEVMCNNCPLYDCENCSSEKLKQALALINRQKAENKKLKNAIKHFRTTKKRLLIENAKLTKSLDTIADQIKMEFYREFDELIPSIMADKIDEIVKECKGDIK